jgi:hypothetical protein
MSLCFHPLQVGPNPLPPADPSVSGDAEQFEAETQADKAISDEEAAELESGAPGVEEASDDEFAEEAADLLEVSETA